MNEQGTAESVCCAKCGRVIAASVEAPVLVIGRDTYHTACYIEPFLARFSPARAAEPEIPIGELTTPSATGNGYGIRRYRGHYHVINWQTGDDITVEGDPFPDAESALAAADGLLDAPVSLQRPAARAAESEGPTPDWSPRPLPAPMSIDWRTVRACLTAARPSWHPSSSNEPDPEWDFATALIEQYHATQQVTCLGCKDKRSPFQFYRCWDCGAFLCESCIKAHAKKQPDEHVAALRRESERLRAEVAAARLENAQLVTDRDDARQAARHNADWANQAEADMRASWKERDAAREDTRRLDWMQERVEGTGETMQFGGACSWGLEVYRGARGKPKRIGNGR